MSGVPRGLAGRDRRRGFTLVELAVTVMIAGILASVAAPAVHYAILKADAARLVGDAHTISLSGYEFLAENGRFPGGAGFGVVPPEFSGYLPDNYAFVYKEVEYRWYHFTFPNTNNSCRPRRWASSSSCMSTGRRWPSRCTRIGRRTPIGVGSTSTSCIEGSGDEPQFPARSATSSDVLVSTTKSPRPSCSSSCHAEMSSAETMTTATTRVPGR